MKEHDQYLRELRRQGYITIRRIHSNHLRIFCPCGDLVSTHPVNGGSDYRALLNFRAEVRRHELRHSAAEQQGEHEQREAGRDERRPDRAGRDHPGYDGSDGEQDERDQDKEPVHAADGETVSQRGRRRGGVSKNHSYSR